MQGSTKTAGGIHRERGMTLFMVAASLLILLGVAALAIDLGFLYVARSEAQRAADAAALAGAEEFVNSGFTSGLVSRSTVQALATQDAITVGGQNLAGGLPAQIQPSDVTFDFSAPEDPRITVTVRRTASRGNPMPTFFAKALGIVSAEVSATATAEAYNPSGTAGPPVGTMCLKPWILPNCDLNHKTPANPNCPGFATFIDPLTGAISHPGPSARGGVIGETLLLKSGNPQLAPVPSQYYPVIIPAPPNPLCPSCGKFSASQNGSELYRSNIECCNSNPFVCGAQGTVDLNLKPGNMQGPTQQGVSCVIHQNPGNGQDILNTSTFPFQYIAGHNNPFAPPNTVISSSDSVVTIPIYDGHALCSGGSSGGSCNSTVTILGFLQVFITNVSSSGDVNGVILNVSGCGSRGGSGSGGVVTGGGGAPVPVRLVRN